MPSYFAEQLLMKICDLCKKVVGHLEEGPISFEKIETCQECNNDLSSRLRQVELRVAECKRQWRNEAFAEWKKARMASDGRIP